MSPSEAYNSTRQRTEQLCARLGEAISVEGGRELLRLFFDINCGNLPDGLTKELAEQKAARCRSYKSPHGHQIIPETRLSMSNHVCTALTLILLLVLGSSYLGRALDSTPPPAPNEVPLDGFYLTSEAE